MMSEEGSKYAWQEHREIRESLLAPYQPEPARPAATFDDVRRIHRQMIAAGLVPPSSGEMH
jgi:hypothetical protein